MRDNATGARAQRRRARAGARSGCRRALRSFVAPRGSRRRRACLFYLRVLAKVNLSYAYASGPGRASCWRRRLETKEEPRVTNGTVVAWVCCAVSFGRFWEAPRRRASRLGRVQAEKRTAVAVSSAVDTATSSHNCKRVGSRCRVSLWRSIALSLQSLPFVEGHADAQAMQFMSKDNFFLVIIALEVAVLQWFQLASLKARA